MSVYVYENVFINTRILYHIYIYTISGGLRTRGVRIIIIHPSREDERVSGAFVVRSHAAGSDTTDIIYGPIAGSILRYLFGIPRESRGEGDSVYLCIAVGTTPLLQQEDACYW